MPSNRSDIQENVDALTIKMSSVKLKIENTAGKERKVWLSELKVLSETMKEINKEMHLMLRRTSYFDFF